MNAQESPQEHRGFREGWLGRWADPDKAACTLIPVVMTIGILLRFWWMSGPAGDDDTRYLDFALRFVSFERFTEQDHAAGRLLFLILIGIPYRVFGHAFHVAGANILYSGLTDIVVVLFCWRRLGNRAGLMAALLMALNPIHLMFPSMIFPDTLLSLFTVLALLILHRASEQDELQKRFRWIAGAGVVACFAYQCKDPGILLVPACCLYLFLSPREGHRWDRLTAPALFVSGFLGVFLLDGMVYWLFTGDFFYKFHATELCHNGDANSSLHEFLKTTCDQFRRTVLYRAGTLLLPFHLGIPVMAASLVWDRRLRLFGGIGLFMALYLIFGTSSFHALIPLPFLDRYFQPVIPMAVIAIAGLSTRVAFLQWSWIRRLLPWGLGLWVLTTGWPQVGKLAGAGGNARYLKSIRAAVELLQDEGQPYYTDPYTHRHLRHFLPAPLYARVSRIPEKGDLPNGFYFLYDWNPPVSREVLAQVSGLSLQRLAEILALPVRVKSCLDARISNEFRQTTYERMPPMIPFFEKRPQVRPAGP